MSNANFFVKIKRIHKTNFQFYAMYPFHDSTMLYPCNFGRIFVSAISKPIALRLCNFALLRTLWNLGLLSGFRINIPHNLL